MSKKNWHKNLVIGVYIDAYHTPSDVEDCLFHMSLGDSLLSDVSISVVFLCDSKSQAIAKTLNKYHCEVINFPKQQQGRALHFNELLAKHFDYYLFLEADVLITAAGISSLLNKFQLNSSTGAIGPSSNNGWNQQSVYADTELLTINIRQRRFEVSNQYADLSIEIDSLLESCFLVSRKTLNTVGLADKNFNNGYCWEVDYHKRIQLAGLSCIWAQDIYAHRTRLLQPSDRDGSYLRNSRLLNLKHSKLHNTTVQGGVYSDPSKPLVSCIMPTVNRADYVRKSIEYFHRQSYPNTELIIVYENDSDIPESALVSENVYLVKADIQSSIGFKRNRAIEFSCGEIIAHWDDDDWYSTSRLEEQSKELLAGAAEISALYNTSFFKPSNWQAWTISKKLYDDMFVMGVHGGTLMYKTTSIGSTRFHDISLREDAIFLEDLIASGARLNRCNGRQLFSYLRHNTNSWSIDNPLFENSKDSRAFNIDKLLRSDAAFYKSQRKKTELLIEDKLPLVSCIIPTKDRPQHFALAIEYFLRQEYDNKELVVVDDGIDPIQHLIPIDAVNIKYIFLHENQSIGQKRNLAIEHANGELILHFDDDDWISKDWLNRQVNELLNSTADVVGIRNVYYYQPSTDQAWIYHDRIHEQPWVLGGSMCYHKSFWQQNKFLDINVGEDADFLWRSSQNKIYAHQNEHHYIGIIHSDNTSKKITDGPNWEVIDSKEIRKLMNSDYQYYTHANNLISPQTHLANERLSSTHI